MTKDMAKSSVDFVDGALSKEMLATKGRMSYEFFLISPNFLRGERRF